MAPELALRLFPRPDRGIHIGPCTNNVAEYEALLIAVELAIALQLPTEVFKGDSQLVITADYKATEATLATYKKKNWTNSTSSMMLISSMFQGDSIPKPTLWLNLQQV